MNRRRMAMRLSQIVVFFYSWILSVKYRKKHETFGQVLIVLGGNIGDVLMDAGAWMSLFEYYNNQKIRVFFTGKEQCWRVFQLISGCPDDRYIRTAGAGGANKNLLFVIDALKEINQYEFDKVIVSIPEYDIFSLCVGAGVKATERWGCFGNVQYKGLRRIRAMLHNRYDHKVIVGPEMHQMQRTRLMLHRLGDENYRAHIAAIPRTEKKAIKINTEKEYIVISVDTSSRQRSWEREKFLELIEFLLQTTDSVIVLTGGKASADGYNVEFSDRMRVINLIGKTDLYEWFEIIRGSRLLIGCDSGAVHVAASTGTPSICLTGGWDGHRVMPYAVDIDAKGTIAPKCVYRSDVNVEDLPCYNCWGNSYKFNKACKGSAPCHCMQKLQVKDVIDVLESVEKEILQTKGE